MKKKTVAPRRTNKKHLAKKPSPTPKNTKKKDLVQRSSPRTKMTPNKRGRTADTTEISPSTKKVRLSELSDLSDSDTSPLEDEPVSKKVVLKTKMSPSGIMKFINSFPTEKQLLDIQSIGFGGLMKLNTNTVPGALSMWLLSTFDPCSCSLMNGALRIEDIDVHLSTGLPMGSVSIQEASSFSRDEYFLSEKRKWVQQFGVDNVTKDVLLDRIISQREGGDDFKRNFIVYITSAFLMGTKGPVASARILNCLGDLSQVSSLNWCSFTRRHMVSTIEKWQTDKNPKKVYKGPIMPLVFIYLDRVEFKGRTLTRAFPTLSAWSRKHIAERVLDEKNYGFGKGAVQARIAVIGQAEKADRGEAAEVVNVKSVLAGEDKIDDPELNVSCSNGDGVVKKLGDAALQLARAYELFSEALNEAQVSDPNSEFVHKMSVLAQGVCHGFSSSEIPPEPLVAPSDETENPVDDDGLRVEDKKKESEQVDKQISDVDSDFLSDAALCALMDDLEKSFVLPPATNQIVSKKEKKKKKEKDPDMPHFDLGSEFETTQESEFDTQPESQHDIPVLPDQPLIPSSSKKAACTPTVPKSPTTRRFSPRFTPSPVVVGVDSGPDLRVEEKVEEVVGKGKEKLQGETAPPLSPGPDSMLPFLTPIYVNPVQEEDRARMQPKRAVVVPENFRSPFMQRNINIFRDLTKLEKLVIDLALLEEDSTSDSEIVFKSGSHTISRSELKTLFVGDKVSKSVINAWCDIMNIGEDNKSKSSPLRLYLYMGEEDGQELPKINFKDVKLVFVPTISKGKPFLFCIHPAAKKVEAIHAMNPKSVRYQDSIKACKATLFERLKDKKLGLDGLNWLDVQEYVPSNSLGDRLDSGIHVMYFMDTYKGSRRGYSCGLSNNDVRLQRFIGRVCYRILCSDLNTLQQKIREDALALPTRKCDPASSNLTLVTARDSGGNALTIKYVKDYLRRSLDQQKVLVDTEWIEVTLGAVKSLNPRGKLMDMVIDAIGIRNCLADPDFLYLPSVVKNLDPQRPETLYTQYVKMSYIPEDGKQVRKVFMPIVMDDHWFAIIVDLEKKKILILNSLIDPNTQIEMREMAVEVVFYVETLIKRDHGYNKLDGMASFKIEFVPVPQQTNIHDCGLFVLKWIEAVNDEGLWTRKDYYKRLTDYRDQKMLELLTWDMNRIKVF